MAVATTPVSIAAVRRAHKDLISAEQTRAAGDLDGAQKICQDLLDHYPDYVGALSVLALTHMHRTDYAQALPLLAKATMLNPKDWVSLTNAGHVYLELEAPEFAIRCLEKSLKLQPEEHSTLYFLGRALTTIQHYKRASEVLERACAAGSQESPTPIWLCECYLHLRRYDDAAKVFKEALAKPLNRDVKAYAYRLAAAFPESVNLELDILSSLNSLGDAQPEDEDATQFNIAFTRALCLERLGRHKEAWSCMVEANAPLKRRYEGQTRTHTEREEELLSICQDWSPREKKPAKEATKFPLSLFILGAAQSGKTSMEGLVGALPGVEVLPAHDLTTATARQISQGAGLLTTLHLCKLPKELEPVIAKTYRTRLLKGAEGADIVTITHPGAVADVGLLSECAPNVKFVFMRRNDDDVAFRMFGQFYNKTTNHFAYDLNAIYKHVSNHRIMIDNWLEKLGDQAMAVQYEDMVSDPESTLARVAKFCGFKAPAKLDWKIREDSGCAEPYRKWLHAARGG